MPREALLTQTFVQLADSLVDHFDVIDLLTLLVDRCVEILDVADAGLMVAAPGGELRVMASSSESMRLLELFEIQTHEGPCLDCYSHGARIASADLASGESRWSRFRPRALDAGFRSVHALPLRLRTNVIGALNLLDVEPRPLPSTDLEVAQALADVSTIAILQHKAAAEAHQLNEQLQQALSSRIVIEQAKGILSERVRVGMQEAFLTLRNHARNHRLPLTSVARGVIDGTLAPESLDRLPADRR